MSQLLIRALLGHTLIDLPTHEECPGQDEEGASCCHHSYLLASPPKEGQIALTDNPSRSNSRIMYQPSPRIILTSSGSGRS
jgi:hypothetical protein